MGTEIEKKYRLSREQRTELLRHLLEIGAVMEGEEFEVNTIYGGGNLDLRRSVLRLRRVGERTVLTYKERFPSSSAIKHQREDETRVEDAGALESILDALGYRPVLVYEKRRLTWRIDDVEAVIDELPFGLFLEIEGEEKSILEVERRLGLEEVEAEMASYPELTARYGRKQDDRVEARFKAVTSDE
jgi:adenylate cyclase class 2